LLRTCYGETGVMDFGLYAILLTNKQTRCNMNVETND